jgi:hypothetical protein
LCVAFAYTHGNGNADSDIYSVAAGNAYPTGASDTGASSDALA